MIQQRLECVIRAWVGAGSGCPHRSDSALSKGRHTLEKTAVWTGPTRESVRAMVLQRLRVSSVQTVGGPPRGCRVFPPLPCFSAEKGRPAARVRRRPVKVKPQILAAVGNLLQRSGAVGASSVFIEAQPIRRPVFGVSGKPRFIHYSGGSAARQDSVMRLRGVSCSPELPFRNRGKGALGGSDLSLMTIPCCCPQHPEELAAIALHQRCTPLHVRTRLPQTALMRGRLVILLQGRIGFWSLCGTALATPGRQFPPRLRQRIDS